MESKTLWEYRVVGIGSIWGAKGEQIEARLNELGLEGWEVVTAMLPHNGGKLVVMAKRPLAADGEAERRTGPE